MLCFEISAASRPRASFQAVGRKRIVAPIIVRADGRNPHPLPLQQLPTAAYPSFSDAPTRPTSGAWREAVKFPAKRVGAPGPQPGPSRRSVSERDNGIPTTGVLKTLYGASDGYSNQQPTAILRPISFSHCQQHVCTTLMKTRKI
jgi:hypothetical protein